MTLGFYPNFPSNIHRTETFSTTLQSKPLQQKLLQVLFAVNRKEYSFEEVAIPTVPGGSVIFEFGLADSEGFTFLDEAELKKAQGFLQKERLTLMDFFCSIRYYRGNGENKMALKFDYYMLRFVFGKGTVELQVFHERGPRYLSPEDIATFVEDRVSEGFRKNVLKKVEL